MRYSEYLSNYNPLEITKPFMIAEAGVNHEGSMDLAKRLIDEAAEAGADAIKFQTYKANTIASKDSPSYWDLSKEATKSQFELFQKYDKFWKSEYEKLKVYCDQAGIEFMSTAFDVQSAVFLNELQDVFKISSSDITNLPFIEFQTQFGKPIILSTGASNLWEIQEAVDLIERNGNPLCLMHCVLNYPTPNPNANLGMIWGLKDKFPQHVIGYSDHTLPQEMQVLRNATLLGARVLEKHFTHDKSLPGNDHYHAMDKNDLIKFNKEWESTQELLGSFKVEALTDEEPARINARRSLVAARSIEKGKVIVPEDLTWKRPASGISPKYFDQVVGKKVAVDIKEDDVMHWKFLE